MRISNGIIAHAMNLSSVYQVPVLDRRPKTRRRMRKRAHPVHHQDTRSVAWFSKGVRRPGAVGSWMLLMKTQASGNFSQVL